MKPTSFLTSITQPHPHRTSLHSHLQSTAYHYNSILHAKSQIDNSTPEQKTCLNTVKNKYYKNVNAQRVFENKKILRSLIDIQRNYTLYGVKEESGTKQCSRGNSSTFSTSKRRSKELASSPQPQKLKSLKNPFVQKMQKLKISSQNAKLYEKIATAQSQAANKKQLKKWSQKIKYLSHFLDSSRQKQCSESYKKQFFSTYSKMRSSTNTSGSTMRLSANSLILNPQLRTLQIQKSKQKSGERYDFVIQEKVKIRSKRKRHNNNRTKKQITTSTLFQNEVNYEKGKLLTEHTLDLSSIKL